jgi:hypothetical protein
MFDELRYPTVYDDCDQRTFSLGLRKSDIDNAPPHP